MSFVTKDNSEYASILNSFKSNNFEKVDMLEGQVSAGSVNVLEAGDKIEWPDQVEFLKNNNMSSSRPVYAIICKVTDKDGAVRYMPWYPTSLGKSLRKLTLGTDGKVVKQDFVRPEGQPAVDYQRQANQSLDTVVKALIAEHPNGILVKDFKEIDTYRFNSKDLTKARQYEYAYV